MRHAKRPEDVRTREFAQRLTRRAFEDAREQVVAAVVVLVLAAGREVEPALAREHSDDGFVIITGTLTRLGPAEQRKRVAKSARMREQMTDCDVIVVILPFRYVLLHLVVERQLALR